MGLVKSVIKWAMPCGLYALIRTTWLASASNYLKYWKVLLRNQQLKSRHEKKDRVFILCNGPSVNQQNLLPLKNEFVISVSSGYLIKDYQTISPKYHCVPKITYGLVTEEDVVAWFREMDEHLGDAELFLSISEYDLVKKHGLFSQRKVYYLCMERDFAKDEHAVLDIANVVPAPYSVPIMALMVAMYMGFGRFYLLGTEHDSFIKGSYNYAFSPTVMKGKDVSVEENGNLRYGAMAAELESLAALWGQYTSMRMIADAANTHILNATSGGVLDVFPRISLQEIFE